MGRGRWGASRTWPHLALAVGARAVILDPGTVMDELGHTDPALALRIYRQATRWDDGEKAKLAGLIEGAVLAPEGTKSASAASERTGPKATSTKK